MAESESFVKASSIHIAFVDGDLEMLDTATGDLAPDRLDEPTTDTAVAPLGPNVQLVEQGDRTVEPDIRSE